MLSTPNMSEIDNKQNQHTSNNQIKILRCPIVTTPSLYIRNHNDENTKKSSTNTDIQKSKIYKKPESNI